MSLEVELVVGTVEVFDVALDEDELLAEDSADVNTVVPEFAYGDDCVDTKDILEEEDDEDALELAVPVEACAELDVVEELASKE